MPKSGTILTPEDQAAKSAAILKAPTKKFRAEHADRFFAWQDTIPAAEWTHLGFHVYRLWPKIIRTEGSKNLEKTAEPLNRDYLRNKWGAGKYWLIMNDSNRGKFGEVCQVWIDLEDNWEEYPPVIEAGDLDMDYPGNQGYINWARAKGLIKMPATTPAAPVSDPNIPPMVDLLKTLLAQRAQNNPGEAAAIQAVMSMMQEGHKQSLAMVHSQASGTDILTQLKAAKELFGGNNENSSMALMMPLILKLLDRQVPPPPPPAAQSEMAHFERFLGLMETIESRIARNGSGTTSWPAVAELAVGKIPETLQHLTSLFTVLGAAKSPQQRPVGRTIDVAPGLPASQPAPAAPPAAAPPTQEEAMQIQQMLAQFGDTIIAALRRGDDGSELAEALARITSLETYERVAAIGKDGIIGALKSSPDLWAKLQPFTAVGTPPVDQLSEFVDEFLEFNNPAPPLDAEQGGAEDAPAA